MSRFVPLLALVLLAGCGTTRYRVPSTAMEPTLKLGTKVKVDKSAYDGHDPAIGDVVVAYPPKGAEQQVCGEHLTDRAMCAKAIATRSTFVFVKRIVGLPGDRLTLRDGHLIRNGRQVDEPFIRACDRAAAAVCTYPDAITVAPGGYYLLGDNRGESDDSRFWGPVPKRWIVGRVEDLPKG